MQPLERRRGAWNVKHRTTKGTEHLLGASKLSEHEKYHETEITTAGTNIAATHSEAQTTEKPQKKIAGRT